MILTDYLKQFNSVAIALSGGVDSSYLLYQCCKHVDNVKAYFVKSQFQPDFEQDDAVELCEALGAKYEVIHVDALADSRVAKNDSKRCYYCKLNIFGNIISHAKADGYDVVFDGTNATDDIADRPGYKALQELKVLSPLRICGIGKSEIRQRAKEAGITLWNKPSYSCLATRVENSSITNEKLEQICACEKIMFALGYSDFRVRHNGNIAKLQIKKQQLGKIVDDAEKIKVEFKPYFDEVHLDFNFR